MTKKGKIVLAVSAIMMLLAVGITYAATVASTATQHQVSTGKLAIQLYEDRPYKVAQTMALEKNNKENENICMQLAMRPGDTLEDHVWVENTGTLDCYVRVLINRSWLREEEKVFDQEISPETIQILSEEGWLVRGSDITGDDEVLECYYRNPITPGERTSDVMQQLGVLTQQVSENSNMYSMLSAQLLFSADAIQAYAPQQAMLAEWGVNATFDEHQRILSITDQ